MIPSIRPSLLAALLLTTISSTTATPSGGSSLHKRQIYQLCVIPSLYASSNGTADDAPAINAAFKQCSANTTISFKEGVDYNVLTPVIATNLNNVKIKVGGNLHLPKNVTYVQNLVNASNAATYATALYWFTLAGPGITWEGSANVSNGWINSYGQAWWDANPANGTVSDRRSSIMP
jgi:hypothetical protein